MPIPLGVLAVAGAGAGPVAGGNAYEWLETVSVGTAVASVTFSNLNNYASDYQHLQIRYVARSTRTAQDSNLSLRFNNDSGTYRYHFLEAYGSGSPSSGAGTATSLLVATQTGNTNVTGAYAAGTIDILDAFETTKNKVTRTLSGYAGGNNAISLRSGLWVNTAALTQIELLNWDGASHLQFSRFSLYGLRSS
jgi:hypothetical protein